ncbi:zinc-ribbon domain containing protein [Candidatus Nomurabacteria bacterium]|nr:zinc-ribbon domain containing protein [Candidatus Nomurabacteria bacterium]
MEHKIENMICRNCKKDFIIESDDFGFYEKVGVNAPLSCPDCRAQLRLSFRNERTFYKRKCDKCGKDSVSMYSQSKHFAVYCYDCWFGDDWGGEDFGLDYNPEVPFFEQFKKLWQSVPKASLIYMRSPGSDYTNISADNKNCYFIVESSNNEDSIHSYWIQECRDVVDTSFASKCELTYESDDCYNSYKLLYSKGCHDCATSYFLTDCKGCTDCIGCINLRNKSNYIFNETYSKEEYEQIKKDLEINTFSGVKNFREKYEDFLKKQPRKFAEIFQAVNSTGSYMKNVKNCKSCFHCYEAEDNKYGVHIWRNAKDTMDCDTAGRNVSLIYNSINAGIDNSNLICDALCWTCSNVSYSMYCFNSNNCFGCVGLRKKNYCILNKQYGKEEYENILNKIKSELKQKGEYGEFFSKDLSCFGYNETPANEQFPLSKEEALKQGFKWEDTERGTYNKETKKIEDMPESFPEVDFDATKEIYVCVSCSKNYKVIPNELLFYKKLDIPLPRLCPDCRHYRRIESRGPNKLWHRSCMKEGCSNEFETSYAPDRPEIVYCERCYQQEVA